MLEEMTMRDPGALTELSFTIFAAPEVSARSLGSGKYTIGNRSHTLWFSLFLVVARRSSYARYAERCLNMVAATTDHESRSIQREMAAEWLRLADAIRRPRRSKQMQMG